MYLPRRVRGEFVQKQGEQMNHASSVPRTALNVALHPVTPNAPVTKEHYQKQVTLTSDPRNTRKIPIFNQKFYKGEEP